MPAPHQNGTVYLNDGSGSFTAADGNLPTHWRGISAGDIDGDGRDELAFVNASLLEVWSWGPGNLWTPRKAGLTVTWNWQRTQLADMDGDARCDLVAFGAGAFGVFRGDGAGGWQQVLALPSPGGGTKLGQAMRASTDVDHNGLPDLAVVQDEGTANRLRVFVETSAPAVLACACWSRPGQRVARRPGALRRMAPPCPAPRVADLAASGGALDHGVLARGPRWPRGSRTPARASGRARGISSNGVPPADQARDGRGERRTYGEGPFTLLP